MQFPVQGTVLHSPRRGCDHSLEKRCVLFPAGGRLAIERTSQIHNGCWSAANGTPAPVHDRDERFYLALADALALVFTDASTCTVLACSSAALTLVLTSAAVMAGFSP